MLCLVCRILVGRRSLEDEPPCANELLRALSIASRQLLYSLARGIQLHRIKLVSSLSIGEFLLLQYHMQVVGGIGKKEDEISCRRTGRDCSNFHRHTNDFRHYVVSGRKAGNLDHQLDSGSQYTFLLSSAQ